MKIFDTPEVQNFINTVAGTDQPGGSPRAKQILHRVVGDLYRTIDDFDITPDEYWSAIAVLNALGQSSQFGLLSPGLGFDHYLDLRMDAAEAEARRAGVTPRTIEGPLYVAGAPESRGFARMDDDPDADGKPMWLHGRVLDTDGQAIANAKVEIWHANSNGGYSFFDPSQSQFNLRRSVITDEQGRYRVRSLIPSGYAVPPGSPTEQVLDLLGRHGCRPAHIHYFVSAEGHQHLTTQINLAGDPYTYDDFAFATRDELVIEGRELPALEEAQQYGMDGPLTAVEFDIVLLKTTAAEKQARHRRARALEQG